MPKKTNQMAWNLTDLYQNPNDPQIEKDFAASDELITRLKTYRDKIASLSPPEVFELIHTWEDLAFTFHKIELFAGLLESTNVNVPDVTRFVKKIEERMVAKGQETIFIHVEFAHVIEPTWKAWLKSPDLAPYANFLQQLHEQAKHTLTEPEEKILAEKSQTSSQALAHLYEVTTDTLSFAWDDQTITLEELMTKFYSADAAVRKQAAHVLHEGLRANDKTTPSLYNALVQDKSINDRLRKFHFPEAERFNHDEVEKPTVEAMLTAVRQAQPLITSYYTLKKQILNTDTLYWWDRYAPLPETKTSFTIDQAKQMVHGAYHEFSPDMAQIVENMYIKQHVDWLPSKTKRGGAFCAMSGKSIYPYVLMNYTTTPRDTMTLAHELGHAIHDVLAQDKNTFLQTHPSLALAEIASTFGEFLLFEKLVSSDTIQPQDRIALIMSFLEDTFSTIFRQATMFEFEQKVHTKRHQEGELSKDEIDTLWHKTMSKPFSESLLYTDEHKNTWMYVGHIIRSPFYVYSYAFAKLCVLSLVMQYKEKGQSFVPVYLKLLQSGGSLSPKDNLAQAGLDITDVAFWQQGLAVINDYIEALKKAVDL